MSSNQNNDDELLKDEFFCYKDKNEEVQFQAMLKDNGSELEVFIMAFNTANPDKIFFNGLYYQKIIE